MQGKTSSLDPDQVRDFLKSYRTQLAANDFGWTIPRQEIAAGYVYRLAPSIVWVHLGGTYFSKDHVALQRQAVETALINLEHDPGLLTPKLAPWEETATMLLDLASLMEQPDSHWIEIAVEAQQLVARLDKDAARQVEELANPKPPYRVVPASRGKIVAILRGAASAAKLLGPPDDDGNGSPATVVNVEQSQNQQQQQAAVSVVSINDLLSWADLPDELRPMLEDMESARQAGDKASFFERGSDFVAKAAQFPALVDKIGKTWEWISTLPWPG